MKKWITLKELPVPESRVTPVCHTYEPPAWAVDHKPAKVYLSERYDFAVHRVVKEVPYINWLPMTEREMMLLKGRDYLYGHEYQELRMNSHSDCW